VVLALRSLGKFPPGGRVSLVRDATYLHRRAPALLEFVARTVHVNLLEEWPGPGRKGSGFPTGPAREAARGAAIAWRSGEAVLRGGLLVGRPRLALLAGLRVAGAFGIRGVPYFEPLEADFGRVAVVPHPSGVNLWLNRPANRRALRRFLEDLAK